MERIQKALNKARTTRGSGAVSDKRPDRTRMPQGTIVSDVVESAWAELPEFSPDPKLLAKNRVLTFGGGKDSAQFDLLRTRVLQQMTANNWRRVAVTSPGGSCGKTTTCANLAFSLMRQSEVRTVVGEFDLRRPNLAKLLGISAGSMQFSRSMTGTTSPEDHMVRCGKNLAFGVNHRPEHNPSELLQSSQLGDGLKYLEDKFDPTLMIFDMPPMLVADDLLGFLKHVDCVLLVAAAGKTTVSEVDICERELSEHTNVLGVALNKCRYLGKSYGYDY